MLLFKKKSKDKTSALSSNGEVQATARIANNGSPNSDPHIIVNLNGTVNGSRYYPSSAQSSTSEKNGGFTRPGSAQSTGAHNRPRRPKPAPADPQQLMETDEYNGFLSSVDPRSPHTTALPESSKLPLSHNTSISDSNGQSNVHAGSVSKRSQRSQYSPETTMAYSYTDLVDAYAPASSTPWSASAGTPSRSSKRSSKRPPKRLPADPQQLNETPLVATIETNDYNDFTSSVDPRSPHTTAPPESGNVPSSYTDLSGSNGYSPKPVKAATPQAPHAPSDYSYSSTSTTTGSPQTTAGSPQTTRTGMTSYQNSPQSSIPLVLSEKSSHQAHHNPAYPQQQRAYPVPTTSMSAGTPASMQASIPTNNWPAQQQYQYGSGQQHYTHRPYVTPGSENQTYPIIMAIDWGTTYSSMAYAYQLDGEVHEVSAWPKQSHSYPKVPTCNLYGPGSKEILEWGYPAKIAMTKPPYKNHVLLSKYKLHLDESSDAPQPLPNGLTVVDAIADYLRLFHAHVLQEALKGFGSAFEQHHIQYCLSVPAMWTDHAKALMRQAAIQAGMITPLDPAHRLLLISEPEAAALYCEKKCDQFSIGHGQRFMICDAGGGTVDLIVFEVNVGPQGRTLREVTRGSGHSCGSIFLDERMETLLRRKFSKWRDRGLTPANWVALMETFVHNVKPLFDGTEDQYITIPAVPGRAELTDYDIGLEDGVLTVTAEEMRREVFDPVVNDVLRLIHHQLQQTNLLCHAIFLVGGFGCSGYLHTRVRSEFGSMVGLIAIPPRAELAVVRGAALAGIAPRTVAARVARRWYGVDSLMAYEPGYDMPHKQVYGKGGTLRAKDRFSVYVAPGQQIGVDECISKRYVTYQYPNPINSPLYACSSMDLPRYVDSPPVEKIGDFLIPLPHIPGAMPGHKVSFVLRMYFGATEIRAEAEVNGVVVSTRCQFTG
ncbi:Heat shock 70 kDa protein 12A [Mortierella sp. GBA30]|nr:Heat shock 70 kDa protein 12A [Mortierella sp. GBA30]